jgi:hypothetical protein
MTIRTAVDSPVAELFRLFAPSYPVTLVIYAGHIGDSDAEFIAIWTGRIQSAKRSASGARNVELSAVPDSASMRRSGLRRHYQLTCPHALYDQDPFSCRANKAAATRAGVVATAVSYLGVTLAPGWQGSFDPAKFVSGMVEWTGPNGPEKRTILRVAGNVLSLNMPTTGLTPGMTVDVVLGCNRQISDCQNLHNNVRNFGGMPFIPTDNPIKTNPFN